MLYAPRKRKCARCHLEAINMIKPMLQDRTLVMQMKWVCWPCLCDYVKIPISKKLRKEMEITWKDIEEK